MIYSQQAPSPHNSSNPDNESFSGVGRSGAMLRLAVVLCTVIVFFVYMLWQFISIRINLTTNINSYSVSFAFTVMFEQLVTNIDIMIAILSIIVIVRLLPIISAFAIYIKSRHYNSAESMIPFLTMIQLFGIVEGLAWTALTVYDVIQIIKAGNFSLPSNASGTYYMMLVVSVIMIVSKIAQGFLIPGFFKSVKEHIRTGKSTLRMTFGLRFASIMLATANAIILIFYVFTVIIQLGIDYFFDTFQYLWFWYLFFLSYTLSNMFFVSVISRFVNRVSLGGVFAPVVSSSQSSSYSPLNSYGGGYRGIDHNAQPSPGQNSSPYQNNFNQGQNSSPYQNNYNQGQNSSPYQNNFSQGQNSSPYQNNYNQSQNNSQYQNNFNQGQSNSQYQNNYNQSQNNSQYQNNYAQGQSSSPYNNNENTGSGFSDDYDDMFKFK